MTVTIYLRSIVQNGEKLTAMFDSKRAVDIDTLITDVNPGDKVVWKQASDSGIKSILKIYSKHGERIIFKTDPKKQQRANGFEMQVPETAKIGDEEEYNIEYVLSNDTTVVLDPFIRIPPPSIPR
jgi:hypothetical protein